MSGGRKKHRLQQQQQQLDQQQSLPLSTLCRSALLKLRRADMPATAVASRAQNLHQFVEVVERGVLAHPQYGRRIAAGGDDAELLSSVVAKLDEVKDQLDDIVEELGFADYEAYALAAGGKHDGKSKGSRTNAAAAMASEAHAKSKALAADAGNPTSGLSRRMERMLRSGDKLASRVAAETTASSSSLSAGKGDETEPRGSFGNSPESVVGGDGTGGTRRGVVTPVSMKDYDELVSANTEMKRQQREQQREIEELRQAMLTLQSQSFVSPVQLLKSGVGGSIEHAKTGVLYRHDEEKDAQDGALPGASATDVGGAAAIPASTISLGGAHDLRRAAADAPGEGNVFGASPMMAYEDLVDFELQRLHAIISSETKDDARQQPATFALTKPAADVATAKATARVVEPSSSEAAQVHAKHDTATIPTSGDGVTQRDTFLISRSELDAMLEDRVRSALEAEIDHQTQQIIADFTKKKEENALDVPPTAPQPMEDTSGGDASEKDGVHGVETSVATQPLRKAFSRLMDAMLEHGALCRQPSAEEQQMADTIERLRALLEEKTQTLAAIESSFSDTVLPGLKRFDVVDESLLLLSRNISDVYAKVDDVAERAASDKQNVDSKSQQMLSLFDERLKGIEDIIDDMRQEQQQAKEKMKEEEEDAIQEKADGVTQEQTEPSSVEAVGIEAAAAGTAPAKSAAAVVPSGHSKPSGVHFVSDPTMKDMISRLKHLEVRNNRTKS